MYITQHHGVYCLHATRTLQTIHNCKIQFLGYKTDIEIAQECEMKPITEIAAKAGIDDKYLEQYGKYKAKIDYNLLKSLMLGRKTDPDDCHQPDTGR